MANNTSDDELRKKISDLMADLMVDVSLKKLNKFDGGPIEKGRQYIASHNDRLSLIMQLIKQREEQVAREIQTLNAHLSFMAGQYEGMTGEKSAYLLKNWPEYKQLTTTHKGDQ